jgi:hypothetical protein
MAYGRRYLAGQQATTVVIGEGAITSDKIVDKAIITRTIDDEAVGSQQIHEESILSGDVKDGEIKTLDLADNSITTLKILDKNVTREKLADDLLPSTRPFSPGVATEEIADVSVTAEKIANDAVETVKVKDLNVTTGKLAELAVTKSKLAAGSVDTDKIEAAAVDVTKLKNLSVNEGKIIDGSCTENKIGSLAISTGKIRDRNVTGGKIAIGGVITENLGPDAVTEPKLNTAALSARHEESMRTRVRTWYDEFNQVVLPDRWRVRADAGGYAYYVAAFQTWTIATPALSGQGIKLDWAEKGINPDDGDIQISFFIPSGGAGAKTYQTRKLGLVSAFDESEYYYFRASDVAGGTPNWYAVRKQSGQAEVAVDTGIAVEDLQILTIEYITATRTLNYYIDGDLVYTCGVWESAFLVDPWISLYAESNAVRAMGIQMVLVQQAREDYA